MNYIHKAIRDGRKFVFEEENFFPINTPAAGANYIIRLHRNYILARLPRYA